MALKVPQITRPLSASLAVVVAEGRKPIPGRPPLSLLHMILGRYGPSILPLESEKGWGQTRGT
ncbi:hypothetical protein ARTHRO9V_100071 [Arthrobacter sp. 9V]|nr:hypothetical protein ARTHRO9V_100071 [Arthrobacter sp. 9V]